MNSKTIELLLLQLEEAFSKSRSNIYSDIKKEKHFIELYNLFIAIKKSDYETFNDNDLNIHFEILKYIFKGLEYLDNSTLNIIPFEIISCLELALDDWIDRQDFIIVTSLSNKNLDFYFESFYSSEYYNQINNYIFPLYNIKITHRLIRISLPKVLSRDYLSMVVLYHELGHFVDTELNISKNIILDKYGVKKLDLYTPTEVREFHHTMEYFADLFAAQYISNASNIFLGHIAANQPESQTHPSTKRRIEVVDEFLNGSNCSEVNNFNDALTLASLPLISIRHLKIINLDIENLIPQSLESKEQLHYIFKLGWDIWHNSDTNFLKDFKSRQKYHIINNLIEKSISNYTIVKLWESKKVV